MKANVYRPIGVTCLFVALLTCPEIVLSEAPTTNETAKDLCPISVSVSLSDGSIVKGTVPAGTTMEISTVFGIVRVPLEKVADMEVKNILERTTQKKLSTSQLIYWNTFDSEEEARHPQVGPEGKLLSGSLVLGKSGKALSVTPGTIAYEAFFPAGTLWQEGCLEFWAKILSDEVTYGNGGSPQFFSPHRSRKHSNHPYQQEQSRKEF